MEHHEDPTQPSTDAPVDRAFAGIVAALAADDPRFARRVTRPGAGGLGRGNIMIILGLVTTVALGVVPLVIGLQTGVVALIAVGAVGCTLLPVAAPLAARMLWPEAV